MPHSYSFCTEPIQFFKKCAKLKDINISFLIIRNFLKKIKGTVMQILE